jgi:hypothetical protein
MKKEIETNENEIEESQSMIDLFKQLLDRAELEIDALRSDYTDDDLSNMTEEQICKMFVREIRSRLIKQFIIPTV